jgi:probable HAF family extracellular repeat protein
MIPSNARRFEAAFTLILVGLLAVLTAILALPAGAQTASFQGLGQMPGAMRGAGSFANAISGDGLTIVGYAWVCRDGTMTCTSSDKTEAFRWTAANKYLVLGDLGSSIGSMALATSVNGSVIVGNAPKGQNSFGAFRWTATTGMVALPVAVLYGNGVTGDGNMVVGEDNWWKISGKVGTFGPFPGNPDQTEAFGVTGTEAAPIAVGAALKGSDANGATVHAFRWTPSGGLQDLGLTTGSESIAVGISANGSVIVGEARDARGFWRAFRWTASTGMEDIGTLGGPESVAYAANHDGSVIVGTSLTSGLSDSNDAFIWTAKSGIQSLRGVLQAQGVHTADAWVQVTSAAGVSANGAVITGFGLSPRTKAFPFGVWTPFRVVLPVP